MAQDKYITLYQKDDFFVKAFSATQWAYVKRIYWGNDDPMDAEKLCRNRKSKFTKVHTFDDGNVIEATITCDIRKATKKNPRDSSGYYLNTKLVKYNKVGSNKNFFDAEDEQKTTGLCTNVKAI
jgi:hypothetical protein